MLINFQMEMSLAPEEYERYYGSTPQEVVTAFEQRNIFWLTVQSTVQRLYFWKSRVIKANPNGGSCVGVHGPRKRYEIFLYPQRKRYFLFKALSIVISS